MRKEEIKGLLPEGTLCEQCTHMFLRTIRPSSPEEYIPSDILDAIDDDDPEDLIVVQCVCLVAKDDIIDVVLSCNRFEGKNNFLSLLNIWLL